MNNYCTNCGNKLLKDDFVCNKCNTPVVDIPYNYKTPAEKEKNRVIRNCFLIIFIFVLGFFLVKEGMYQIFIYKLKKEYVVPYIKKMPNVFEYEIKYDSSGQCIKSGNCKADPVMGCDGGMCEEYKYENDCKSYYFNVEIDGIDHIITVVEKNNQYYAVEGKNIYGKDKKQEDLNSYSEDEVGEEDYE